MNLVGITIGNRDIEIKNENLPYNSSRKNGRYILKNFSELKNKIFLPIIQPFIDSLKDREVTIGRIILIATDQKDEKFRDSDSINFAKVIKQHFERKNYNVKITKVCENVGDFIKNYNYFRYRVEKIKNENVDKFYILPVGGIPNINTAFLLASILHFKDKLEQYYVKPFVKNAYPVPFNHIFLKEIEKGKIETALEKYLFSTVSNVSSNHFVKRLSDYAFNRISFNFKKAKIIADDMIHDFPNKDLNKFSNSISAIRNNEKLKLQEIFFSTVIKIKQEQYADALLRLYNFADNILRLKICELYDVKLDMGRNFQYSWYRAIKNIKKGNPKIESRLEHINGSKAKLEHSGLPLYNRMIKYKDSKENILEISVPLEKISGLRNNSISAHGFSGISIEKIENKLKEFGLDLDNLLDRIEKHLNSSFDNSIYTHIINLIKQEIKSI